MAKRRDSNQPPLDAAFPRPPFPEPPSKLVHKAMKEFPAAVANGGSFWGGPLVTSTREWQAAPHIMSHLIIDANADISLPAAAWGVFRLAELGLLSPTQEKANDGTTFWRTTPALWDWWKAECPLAKPTRITTRDDEPTPADLLVGREVLKEMTTRNPSVESFREAVRGKGLKGSNAKLGKLLSHLKGERLEK